MNEIPQLMSTSYAASNAAFIGGAAGAGAAGMAWEPFGSSEKQRALERAAAIMGINNLAKVIPAAAQQETVVSDKRRLVRVVVVDPHDDVPVEIALLYDSKEVFTDKTDQELYFDVPIAQILKDHNEKRAKIVNKAVKDRTEYLEPARIRDLKMLVISLATF